MDFLGSARGFRVKLLGSRGAARGGLEQFGLTGRNFHRLHLRVAVRFFCDAPKAHVDVLLVQLATDVVDAESATGDGSSSRS